MPIPPHKPSGVLPACDETNPAALERSPYRATIEETARAFCTSLPRYRIFEGFIRYRAALRALGIVEALHWIDGSFVEQADHREPSDVDVVTFLILSPAQQANWQPLAALVMPGSKATYLVDGYILALNSVGPYDFLRQVVYWYSLFSHRRGTSEWKGLIELPLATDVEDQAALHVAREVSGHGQAQ